MLYQTEPNDLFKIHFSNELKNNFDLFPDIYKFNICFQKKFQKLNVQLQIDIFNNLYNNRILYSQNNNAISNIEHLNVKQDSFMEKIEEQILLRSPGLFLSWDKNPQKNIYSKNGESCSFFDFLEYFLSKIYDLDKEMINDYLNKYNNSTHFFKRNNIDDDCYNFCGLETITKIQRDNLYSEIQCNQLKNKKNNKI